jgi:hypothetical protein
MNGPMPPEEALLPWVSLSKRPQRIGVFQVRNTANRNDDLSWFSFWDGARWHGAWRSPDEASQRRQFPSPGSVLNGWEWRGLAKNPHAEVVSGRIELDGTVFTSMDPRLHF